MTVTSPAQIGPVPPGAGPLSSPGSPADAVERPAGPSLSPSRAADFKTCPLLFRFRTIDRLPERTTPDQVRGTLVHAVLEHLFDLPAAERTPAAAAALVAPEWARLVEQEPALADLFAEIPPAELEVPAQPPAIPLDAGAAGAGAADPAIALPSGAEVSESASAGPGVAAPGAAQAGPGVAEQPVLDGMPDDETARLAAFLRGAGGLLDGYFAVEDPRRLEPAEREALVSTLVDDQLLIRGYIDRLDVSPAGDTSSRSM